MRIAAVALICLLVLGGNGLLADDGSPSTTEQQYRAILEDFEAARRAFATLEAGKTDDHRQALRSQFPGPQDYYERLLTLAEAHPREDAAVDALVWIVATSVNGYDAFKERGVRIKRAMDLLVRDHLEDPRVGYACLDLVAGAAPLRDEFLHEVYARSTDRRVKGRACLALGEFLLGKSETVSHLKGPSGVETMKYTREHATHRLTYYEQLLREEPEALASRGEELLRRTIDDYGDIAYHPTLDPKKHQTLAEVARLDLRRLHQLAIGQQAPEIDGQDVEGVRFKLSDYRGRVVLLTFSGNWCGPCRAMYPDERALVERLKDRPFAMLSVNTDQTRETLRKSISQGEITWKCWWEPGIEGPICTRWAMEGSGFPQVYLLDHKGVIRGHGMSARAELDRTIDGLIQACEAERRSTR